LISAKPLQPKTDESGGGIFTGERLVADDPLFAADMSRHLVAYRFAQKRVAGRMVLDAGCGDGYGTHLLAETALGALGVDRSADTIALARRRYARENLRYEACDLASLDCLGARFDVVCNFQVLEHLVDPLPFLLQVRAVLREGGTFILTTPNRAMAVIEIPYHVHEYVADELQTLLASIFAQVEVKGVVGDERAMSYERTRIRSAQRILALDPLNLRRLVPNSLIEFAYPHLARWVRRSVRRNEGSTRPVSVDNFTISDNCDEALDLLALCHL